MSMAAALSLSTGLTGSKQEASTPPVVQIATSGRLGAGEAVPTVNREFRAVWVATVDNIDWPSKRTLSVEQQKAELIAILNRAQQLNLNAIVFQVRPACDALYDSPLEPWSEYLTGKQGQPPDPYYDPLTFAIEEAHKRGMELHAWINPYRAKHPSAKGQLADSHIVKTKPDVARKYGQLIWLDPGEPDTQAHSLAVIQDIVRRYDVDGIHMDDYFYPYHEIDSNKKDIPFPDDPSYKRYKSGGGTLGKDDWRRENVNVFIEKVYKSVKAEKPWVKLGVSPFGIYRPGYPEGIKGFDAYQEIYCDAKKWLNNGWLDYLAPQLYWAIGQKEQSYPVLLKWWVGQNTQGRHIWPGNYTTKVGENSKKAYSADEIVNQIKATRNQTGSTGNIHFSMEVFMQNRLGLCEKLTRSVYSSPALIPASPWLSSKQPGMPLALIQIDPNTSDLKLAWSAPQTDKAALWVLQTRSKNPSKTWKTQILPGSQQGATLNSGGHALDIDEVALSLVDRYGNQGKPFVFELK